MFSPRFRIRGFGSSLDQNLAILHVLLGSLVAVNRLLLRTRPGIPSIYRSGVRYVRDQPGMEDWCDVLEVLRQGFADCKSFAAWRVAELRENGIMARCEIRHPRLLPNGMLLYHIRVRLPDGTIEDPSVALGMRSPHGRTGFASHPGIGRGYRRRFSAA